jgi:MOSC domain-containing protein YiiM
MGAQVTAVSVVFQLLPDLPGQVPEVTAIDKRPVPGRVPIQRLGLAGDTQCDTKYHGGPDQAVYAYADEDAAYWAAELGRPVPPGLFGENLRISGLDVTNAEVGERWQLGEGPGAVLVEVTAPRTPCVTFQHRMQERAWVKRFTAYGAAGAYLRVLREGTVAAGDPVTVVHRPGHGVSIKDVLQQVNPDGMRRLLELAEGGEVALASSVRTRAKRVLARA